MTHTLHIILEIDADHATLQVDDAARVASAWAQDVAMRTRAVVRVVDYSVAALPVGRDALERGLALVGAELAKGATT